MSGNAALFVEGQQVYLVLGKTPRGRPCVLAEPPPPAWTSTRWLNRSSMMSAVLRSFPQRPTLPGARGGCHMPGRAAKVTITERQQQVLRTMTRASTSAPALAQRAGLILLAFDGL